MSYANVVPGRLKLKGKALGVKSGSLRKKGKRSSADEGFSLAEEEQEQQQQQQILSKESLELVPAAEDGGGEELGRVKEKFTGLEDHRTAAEKRYDEQKAKLDARTLAKTASKSHRQKVEEFNQYLANLGEHYDIPKVGPG